MVAASKEKEQAAALKRGQRVALAATLATLVLAVVKAAVGWRFDSPVLVADAFHSGADLLAIFASFFGLWLAARQKSERFPYGLYRAETLVTFLVGALIIWAGVELLQEGWDKLLTRGTATDFPLLPLLASAFSIVASLFIALKERQVGQAINSQSLLANAAESFLDIVTSTVVLFGILLNYWRIPYVEGAIVMLIAVLVIKLGGSNAWQAFLVLLDANLDAELAGEIEQRINAICGVKGVSEVRIRQAGPFRMVDCIIVTSPTLPLYRAHELADLAEKQIMEHCEHIESVFIHIEPARDGELTAIVPVKEISGRDSRAHGHFGRAPYFALLRLGEDGGEIEDFFFNEFLGEKKFIGLKVIKALIVERVDVLFTPQVGEISFYMLKDNFVDIYQVSEDQTVGEILQRYGDGTLPLVTQPTHSVDESLVERPDPSG
jgi:cation diffusion facilitator family transporter